MATTYRKTAKGQAEIETRVNRLAQRLRMALIMVDGRRSDEELARLIPAEAIEVLSILLEAGYIEAVPMPGPVGPVGYPLEFMPPPPAEPQG